MYFFSVHEAKFNTFDLKMRLTILSLVWLLGAFIASLGLFITKSDITYLKSISSFFTWGKLRKNYSKETPFEAITSVPKSVIINGITLCIISAAITFSWPWQDSFRYVLDWLRYPLSSRESENIGLQTALIILGLEQIQVMRRWYECTNISIFSDGKMSLVHFVAGIALYSTFGLTILSETGLNRWSLRGSDAVLGLPQLAGLILFTWASVKQHRSFKILADLRRNKNGKLKDMKHHIPSGDLFDYVSSPHYLCEILIYLSFNMIVQFEHHSCLCISVFVLVNQSVASYMSHQWYCWNFPKYPASRKALIPFLL